MQFIELTEDGAKVAFTYEPEGELREIQNEKRHPYSFWYDPCRRVNRVRGFDPRIHDVGLASLGQFFAHEVPDFRQAFRRAR